MTGNCRFSSRMDRFRKALTGRSVACRFDPVPSTPLHSFKCPDRKSNMIKKRSEQVIHFPSGAGLIHPNDRMWNTYVPENPMDGHQCGDCDCPDHEWNQPSEPPLDPLNNVYDDE